MKTSEQKNTAQQPSVEPEVSKYAGKFLHSDKEVSAKNFEEQAMKILKEFKPAK